MPRDLFVPAMNKRVGMKWVAPLGHMTEGDPAWVAPTLAHMELLAGPRSIYVVKGRVSSRYLKASFVG